MREKKKNHITEERDWIKKRLLLYVDRQINDARRRELGYSRFSDKERAAFLMACEGIREWILTIIPDSC